MLIFYLFFIITLTADIVTKWWVQAHIPLMQGYFYPYGGIGVFYDFFGIEFAITHVTNTGAAWGMLSDHSYVLVFLRICFIGFLLFEIKKSPISLKKPLILILSGAFGNLIDAFLYGHVIDMFRFVFWGWPFAVFNVADACVSIGIVWLIIATLFFHDTHYQKSTAS